MTAELAQVPAADAKFITTHEALVSFDRDKLGMADEPLDEQEAEPAS